MVDPTNPMFQSTPALTCVGHNIGLQAPFQHPISMGAKQDEIPPLPWDICVGVVWS